MTYTYSITLYRFVDAITGETAWQARAGPFTGRGSTVVLALNDLSRSLPSLVGEGLYHAQN